VSAESPPSFKPITVQFVIESETELHELWARLHIPFSFIQCNSGECLWNPEAKVFLPVAKESVFQPLMKALGDFIEKKAEGVSFEYKCQY
jgi:hypothetical protein